MRGVFTLLVLMNTAAAANPPKLSGVARMDLVAQPSVGALAGGCGDGRREVDRLNVVVALE